jgi:hypothetical protein
MNGYAKSGKATLALLLAPLLGLLVAGCSTAYQDGSTGLPWSGGLDTWKKPVLADWSR